jgi:hypothetical protein
MLEWLHRLRVRKARPLSGAPRVRRLKTYSAQSGYVYLYYFEGSHITAHGADAGREYLFQVSADRKAFLSVPVFVPDLALTAWEEAHHPLIDAERYAVAKIALFQAFDERPEPALMKQPVLVRRADADAILDSLGLE